MTELITEVNCFACYLFKSKLLCSVVSVYGYSSSVLLKTNSSRSIPHCRLFFFFDTITTKRQSGDIFLTETISKATNTIRAKSWSKWTSKIESVFSLWTDRYDQLPNYNFSYQNRNKTRRQR